MRRFNILYVENFGDIIGGGQVSLLGLLDKLDKDKFRPIVVCPSDGSLSKKLRNSNINTHIIKMQSLRRLNFFNFYGSVSRLREPLINEQIDLVHANGSRAAVYAGIAARREKIPLVWHVRIADRDILLDRFLAGLSTQIIAISEAVAKRFSWMHDIESKVKTVYNGIDLEKFNPSLSGINIKSEFKLSLTTPLIGTVGRLDWYKGHKYLLKAARIVVDNVPECQFLIVGEGEKRKELEGLSDKLNLNNNVIFTGYREDIPEILASLDLFVLPSVSEGLGRSIIEAMAMGKAVVATNAGGIPEVVKDGQTGILVPAKNEHKIAEAILELIRDKDRMTKMGLFGRELLKVKFDIKINVEEIQNIYLQILNNGRPD
jgi:glycosyltransferase involved in cell wall biosynthesis